MSKATASQSLPRFAASFLGRKSSSCCRGRKSCARNDPSRRFLHARASVKECRLMAPVSSDCSTFHQRDDTNGARWRGSACHFGHRDIVPFYFQWNSLRSGSNDVYLDFRRRRYSTSGTRYQEKGRSLSWGSSTTQVSNIVTRKQGDNNAPSDFPSDLSHSQQQQQQSTTQSTPQSPNAQAPTPTNLSYLPPSLLPYAHLSRLDKPIGTYLLLHPCLWSTALAATPLGSPPDLGLCALFAAGSFIMRGAGCTINDMWDAKFDGEVERTKNRPLASGAVTLTNATGWLGVQLCAGLGVLVSLPHVEQCFVWGVASLPLVVTYPLMKRYTNYPQVVLGMTFNWGAIMGWVAVHGEVDWSVVGPLYLSGVGWTLVYDTLYAHQDRVDDAKLGLKSTALTFGERTKPILSVLTAATWSLWMATGYNCGYGLPWEDPYYYVGCSMAAVHLMWQVQTSDLNNAENLAYRFRSNNLVGWMMFGSCALGNIMAGGHSIGVMMQ